MPQILIFSQQKPLVSATHQSKTAIRKLNPAPCPILAILVGQNQV